MIATLSVIIMLAFFINLLFNWITSYKNMETNIFKTIYTMGYAGALLATFIILDFIYRISQPYSVISIKFVVATLISMGILFPASGYLIIWMKILNAKYASKRHNSPFPEDYGWWIELKRIALVLTIVDIIIAALILLDTVCNWDDSIIGRNWNNVVVNGKMISNY